jgi:uroporphyrinogen-III decarboxylase
MARNFENMPEEQLRQEREERRSVLEKAPAATLEQAFVKEVAVALGEVQEQLEDEVRAGAAAAPGAAAAQGAEGQEQARVMAAKRKMTAQVTKWATRMQVAAKDGVTIAAKVFGGGGSSYVGLSVEEVAALKAAKKEAEAGKKKEEIKENKAPYSR